PRTAVGTAPQTPDQIELEWVETALIVEYRIVDMRQQHFGEDQMAIGLQHRIRLDLRHAALEGYRRTGDTRHIDTLARLTGDAAMGELVDLVRQDRGTGIHRFGLGVADQLNRQFAAGLGIAQAVLEAAV